MLAGAWFYLVARRQIGTLLLAFSGLAILLAIPVSISRSLFVGVFIVAAFGIYSLVTSGLLSSKMLLQLIVGSVLIVAIGLALPATNDALDAFLKRWENSTERKGGVEEAIIGRIINDLTRPFSSAPVIGLGTGISTQVGQKLLTGTKSFGYSEGEWGRVLVEGGLLLGCMILIYRLALFAFITTSSFRAAFRDRPFALPLWAAAAPLLLMGQWGQTTTLGSMVIATGVCLVATQARSPQFREIATRSVARPRPQQFR
jgi:hypothetical protein